MTGNSDDYCEDWFRGSGLEAAVEQVSCIARITCATHFCGNCGCDSTWSRDPIVSTPLKLLHDQLAKSVRFEEPNRTLNLDEYSDYDYEVWATTPAIMLTADRPQ